MNLSLDLVPAFSPGIYDYYVACPDPTNPIMVTMTAAPGSTIGLLEPLVTPPAVASDLNILVQAGTSIVVGLNTGDATLEYWIRCLPPDFPLVTVTTYADAGAPTPGYYLVGTTSVAENAKGYAMALDVHGVPIWYEAMPRDDAAYDVESLTAGTISLSPVAAHTGGTDAREYEVEDLTSGELITLDPAKLRLSYHELRALPDGNYLVLSDPILDGVDLRGLGFGASSHMIGCLIDEVNPAGEIVWQWDATDHFDVVKDSTYPTVSGSGAEAAVDPMHCNSIDVDASGDLLVSARNMDSVFKVSRASGAVLWKLGGAGYTKEGAPYVTVEGDPMLSFFRQHDARLQPDGTISMFDDQTAKAGPARAVVYALDLDARTARVVWQRLGASEAADLGSVRIYEDGSRVIGWGAEASGAAFSEVNEAGDALVDFAFAATNETYRAVKVPLTALDLSVLRSRAGAAP